MPQNIEGKPVDYTSATLTDQEGREFILGAQEGKGGFSVVNRAQELTQPKQSQEDESEKHQTPLASSPNLAIKIARDPDKDDNNINLDDEKAVENFYDFQQIAFANEVAYYKRLSHENLPDFVASGMGRIALKGSDVVLEKQFIAMELMDHDLSNRALAPNEIINVMRQLSSVVDYLHENGLIHPDLKPDNILAKKTDNSYVYKLTDLASISRFGGKSREMTFEYTSLEEFYLKPLKKESDIYKLGLIMGELYFGTKLHIKPGEHYELQQIAENIGIEFNPYLYEMQKVLDKALHDTPSKRYGSGEAFYQAIVEAHQKGVSALEDEGLDLNLDLPLVNIVTRTKSQDGFTAQDQEGYTKRHSDEELQQILSQERARLKTIIKDNSTEEGFTKNFEEHLRISMDKLRQIFDTNSDFLKVTLHDSGLYIDSKDIVDVFRSSFDEQVLTTIKANVSEEQFTECMENVISTKDFDLFKEWIKANLPAFPALAIAEFDEFIDTVKNDPLRISGMINRLAFRLKNNENHLEDERQLRHGLAMALDELRSIHSKLGGEKTKLEQEVEQLKSDKDLKLRLADEAREEIKGLFEESQNKLKEEAAKQQGLETKVKELEEAKQKQDQANQAKELDQARRLREKDARIRELEAELRRRTSSTPRDNPQNRQTPPQPRRDTRTRPLPEDPFSRPTSPTSEDNSSNIFARTSHLRRHYIDTELEEPTPRTTKSPEKRKFRSPINIRGIMGVGFLASVAFVSDLSLSALTDDELMEQRRRGADVDGQKYFMEHIEKRWSQLGNLIGLED